MVFPESPRVIYGKNTLTEVICELRFPPILKIEASQPAEMQERVRSMYPLFEEKRTSPPFPPGMPQPIQQMIAPEMLGVSRTTYEFGAADNSWKVGLNKESLSLSTTSYERWEDFRQRMENLWKSFCELYRPSYCSRLGLRYQNGIVKAELGIEKDRSWSALLRPEIIGELADHDIGKRVLQSVRESDIQLDDDGIVHLRHFLAERKAPNSQTVEQAYVIDADYYYTGRTEVNDVWQRLDSLNRESGRLFRWCITDTLHDAMEPDRVD